MGTKEVTVESLRLTPQQQEVIRETLRALLDYPQFRRSRRYPAFLEFVVFNTLAGRTDQLKERVVAEEVFGRSGDYDPSNDPIVRYTAGEVRKRMALYFSEHPEAPVRIDLPPGGYMAEFHFRPHPANGSPAEAPQLAPGADEGDSALEATQPISRHAQLRAWISRRPVILAAALLLIIAGTALWRYEQIREQKLFWWPVLHGKMPALIVMGEGPESAPVGSASTNAIGQSQGQIPVGDALASTAICNVFHQYEHDCKFVPMQTAHLDDLLSKSVISIGAFDNAWTLRLLAPCRFQFQSDGTNLGPPNVGWKIVDRFHPATVSTWAHESTATVQGSYSEYAIVGRFHSEITGGMVVVVAGLGPPGTSGAAQYISSPDSFEEILALAPKGWKGLNFEAVLQIEVVQGSTGPVKIVAEQFW